jgi:hypothetical protein
LYGLKYGPKQWHEKFDLTLISVGFSVNEADWCAGYHHGVDQGVTLWLYVDGILIFETSLDMFKEVNIFLCQSFDIKDLDEADVILNIKLIKGENQITLTQSHYVENVLNHFGFKDNKPSPTPYDLSLILWKNKRINTDQLRYSQIIRSPMYLASATRSDISFAIRKLSQFTSNPGDGHWHALELVMHYLAGIMDYRIYYSRYPLVLEGYSDAN